MVSHFFAVPGHINDALYMDAPQAKYHRNKNHWDAVIASVREQQVTLGEEKCRERLAELCLHPELDTFYDSFNPAPANGLGALIRNLFHPRR